MNRGVRGRQRQLEEARATVEALVSGQVDPVAGPTSSVLLAAANALRAAEERYRVLLDAAPDAMVVFNDRGEIQVAIGLNDEPRPIGRVIVHQQPLLRRELAGFREDLERNADLADVMQQTRDAEQADLRRAASNDFGEAHREHRHVQRVRGGILIEFLEAYERQDDVRVSVHRDGKRTNDRLGLEQRNHASGLRFVLKPV